MRIRRLDLLKYGHFAGAGLDLPAHTPDFHMVFGLNEAGKSTALSAIEDLLFGVPHNSPLNFMHDYPSMRLGALVEADVAELSVLAQQIEETKEVLEGLREQEQALSFQADSLDGTWRSLWIKTGLEPLSSDVMLEWIGLRSRILQIISRQSSSEREARALRDEETSARDLLVRQLNGAGIDTAAVADRPLRVVLEFASQAQRQNESQAAAIWALEEKLAKAASDTVRKRKTVEAADSRVTEWQGQWADAISDLGLNPASPFETLDAQINAIDELREAANRISDLRHERI